ncbi:MAG TPA: cytochrome c peroxidase [Segetibacter sp.]
MSKKFNKQFKVLFLLAGIFFMFGFFSFNTPKRETHLTVLDFYKKNLDSLNNTIIQFEKDAPTATNDRMKQLFLEARLHYKKIEFIVEYHYPSSAQKLNGPVLIESEPSEPNEPQHPSGFQVLEESVYDVLNDETRKEIIYELSNINNRINRLYTLLPELELSESNILDALKLNLYRLITKGITGFDSPVALKSIDEAAATLQSAREILSLFAGADPAVVTIEHALFFIKESGNSFNEFNRAIFVAKNINLVCKTIYAYQVSSNIPFTNQRRAIAVTAQTLFDKEAFNPLFYAPSGTVTATAQQIALGKKLFSEPLLSANGQRSCNSCHVPEKAFTDGLALNEALIENKKLLRNTPTLLNAALQPVQFYDSHIAFLEDQAHDVISNRQEMGGLFESITKQLMKNKLYRREFVAAYRADKITTDNIKKALAAYVRSLIKMNSPFDRYMRGSDEAMNDEALKGFNLFMGKAKCGTCHFMPLFTGTVPPLYDKMESEVLGIPAGADTLHPVHDLDSGKYHLYNIPHQLYSFKTSTVRNAALTAPYMHNGVYQTLEEVIDFYNRGGGAGLGFQLPNQTLSPDKLNLNSLEKKQIIAFISALTNN